MNKTFKIQPVDQKKVLMAPAFISNGGGGIFISNHLFRSEKDAREHLEYAFVSWPAILNKDGFYEVPE